MVIIVCLYSQPPATPPDPIIFTIAPTAATSNDPNTTTTTASSSSACSSGGKKQDIVLLVAPPACGKSTLSQRFIDNGYIRINQDTLRSIDKCLAAGRKHLLQGQSVCVDNTNMDVKARARWVQLAKEFHLQVRQVTVDALL